MAVIQLDGFGPIEKEMIEQAIEALQVAGYNTEVFHGKSAPFYCD